MCSPQSTPYSTKHGAIQEAALCSLSKQSMSKILVVLQQLQQQKRASSHISIYYPTTLCRALTITVCTTKPFKVPHTYNWLHEGVHSCLFLRQSLTLIPIFEVMLAGW